MDLQGDFLLALRVFAAFALSSLVGLERELRRTSVGLRTHALVGVCTALFVALAELMVGHFSPLGPNLRFDPLAVLGATVSGISFLGAGAVIASSAAERRQSLTSAASVLGTAGIGLTCGLAHYPLAVMLSLLVLLILNVFRRVEARLLRSREAAGPHWDQE